MKGVLVISTALALFAAGSVQTHSRQLMSQPLAASADRPVSPVSGKTRSAAPLRSRSDRTQQAVPPTAATHDTPVVPTAMLAPASLPVNPRLISKIQSLLPTGMAADQAAFGFRTQMQFVSAVFAGRNLGIPFGELKTRLLTQGMTLDETIKALRPNVDATVEADRALRQADAELSNRD
jgi:hypothetical protein